MKRLIFLAVLLGITTACTPVRTKTIFDEKINFNSYKTFCWLQGCEFVYEGPERHNDSIALDKIRSALVSEMISRGFIQNEDDPDLLIDFHVIVEEKTAMISFHPEYMDAMPGRYNQPVWKEYNYLKGSLLIDIIDRRQSRMIWRSSSEAYLEAFPIITDKQIERSVEEALKDFPPEQSN